MEKLNLIVITPDQLRADYLGCYGHPNVSTPNIDALAQRGVRFDKMYCAAPLCGPSRVSFATSTYFSEHNHRNYWSTISPDVPNIVTSLKRAGYTTGMFGKNHLFTYDRLPELWDVLDEVCLGNYDGHPEYTHSFSSFTLAQDHPFNITARLTDEAIAFATQCGHKPYFLWLNYQDPHPAFCCPAPYDTMFNPDEITLSTATREFEASAQPVRNAVWRKHSQMDQCSEADLRRAIAHYMGQVRYVDDQVGRIVQHLRQTDTHSKTVLLFFSDHGELLGDYGMTHKNPTFYDCLTRIPAILVHPDGRWENTTFGGLTEEVDLAPTLLELLGVPIPPTMVGTSWYDALNHRNTAGKETALCEAGGGCPTCTVPIENFTLTAPHAPTSFGPGAMLRWQQYKLCVYGDDLCELYNLEEDPHELLNLYHLSSYANVRGQMLERLLKRLLTVKVRDIGQLEWSYPAYPYDVRFEPLESAGTVLQDIRASGAYD